MELMLIGEMPLADAACVTFATGANRLVIDATRLEFACPLDLAGMVTTAHWAASNSMPVTLKMPTRTDTGAYLQRMDVLGLMPSRTRVEGAVPPDTRADLRDRLLEVTPLTRGNVDTLAERVGRLVTAFYKDHSVAAGHLVYRACGELLTNAIEHGDSPTGAFIAAQTYSGGTTGAARFEFAVCDTGVGVLAHLRGNTKYAHLTRDEIALSLAVQAGVSGVGDDRGNGLSDLVHDTRQHGSISFRMRSGSGEIQIVGTAERSSDTRHDRPEQTSGTWAWLSHRIQP